MLTEKAANVAANAVTALLDGGVLRIYDASDTLLAELGFSGKAFKFAAGGVAVSHPLEPDRDARATGTASWFRCVGGRGETVIEGRIGRELMMNSAEIRKGAEVFVDEFKYTQERE